MFVLYPIVIDRSDGIDVPECCFVPLAGIHKSGAGVLLECWLSGYNDCFYIPIQRTLFSLKIHELRCF